jgi:hypothetical protein
MFTKSEQIKRTYVKCVLNSFPFELITLHIMDPFYKTVNLKEHILTHIYMETDTKTD